MSLEYLRSVHANSAADAHPQRVLAAGAALLGADYARPLLLARADYCDVLEVLLAANIAAGDGAAAARALARIEASGAAPAGSARVRLLRGRLLEHEERWADARALYDELVAADETDMAARKRLVAVAKAAGDPGEATRLALAHVDTFAGDAEAWAELAALYAARGCLQQALFCLEECVLLRPLLHAYHLRYADTVAALGDARTAAKYYCRVLELCPGQVAALYGLRWCCERVLREQRPQQAAAPASPSAKSGSKGSTSATAAADLETYTRLLDAATAQLRRAYGGRPAGKWAGKWLDADAGAAAPVAGKKSPVPV